MAGKIYGQKMNLFLNLQSVLVFFVGPWVAFFMGAFIACGLAEAFLGVSRGQTVQLVRIVSNESDL